MSSKGYPPLASADRRAPGRPTSVSRTGLLVQSVGEGASVPEREQGKTASCGQIVCIPCKSDSVVEGSEGRGAEHKRINLLLEPRRHVLPRFDQRLTTRSAGFAVEQDGGRMLASECRGCMGILTPQFYHLSPVCGLISVSSPSWCSNLHNCHLPPHGLHYHLSRELFFQPGGGGVMRVTKTISKAGAHVTPEILGTILALVQTASPGRRIKAVLNSIGVETNKVHGEWTGVSFARWERLVSLVGSVSGTATESNFLVPNGGAAVLLRFLWEKSRSKECLLSFFLSLDRHSSVSVLQSGFANDLKRQEAFLQQAFLPAEIEDETILEQAALTVLDPGVHDSQFAQSFEQLAAGMSAVHAFRTAVRVERHCYKGGKEVPDCVEVVLREVIELLIYDIHTRRFDAAKLPPTCSSAVRKYFEMLSSFETAREASKAWYLLCQELSPAKSRAAFLPEYISCAPGGEPYELKPTMETVASALGVLLLGSDGQHAHKWRSLSDMVGFWNRSCASAGAVHVHEERAVKRSLVHDDGAMQEKASLSQKGLPFRIEITLEPAHNLATVRHVRDHGQWLAKGGRAYNAHLQRWRTSHTNPLAGRERVLHALWPAMLGGARLDALPNIPCASPQQILDAVLSAPWSASDRERWDVSTANQYASNFSVAERDAEQRLASQRTICALAAVSAQEEAHLARALVPWLVHRAPQSMHVGHMAAALRRAPRDVVGSKELVDAAQAWGGAGGVVLERMLEASRAESTILKACAGLGVADAVRVALFGCMQRMRDD